MTLLYSLASISLIWLVIYWSGRKRKDPPRYPSPDRKRVAKVIELDAEERAISD